MFEAILIEKDDAAGYRARSATLDEAQLPEGDVTVRVDYSTLNYKDALAITGKGPVVRKFPMVPGIDLAGTVEASANPDFEVGDAVLLNGWGVGENHWGGLAQKARLDGRWLIPLPRGFTARQAMAVGTAGYTAMLSVLALERPSGTPRAGRDSGHRCPRRGSVASPSPCSPALGYRVAALTRRPEPADYRRSSAAARSSTGQLFRAGRSCPRTPWPP